jgi:hypothetical protein
MAIGGCNRRDRILHHVAILHVVDIPGPEQRVAYVESAAQPQFLECRPGAAEQLRVVAGRDTAEGADLADDRWDGLHRISALPDQLRVGMFWSLVMRGP